MPSFEAIFNCMFLAVIIYQAVYFLVQFAVIKRVELFYYSMFLLCLSIFYYAYVLADIFHINFPAFIETSFVALKAPNQFTAHLLYVLFIIHYLELQKTRGRIYRVCVYYKYYNLIFTIVFLLLGIFQVESSKLFRLATLPLLIVGIAVLVMLWQLNTIYSRVIFYGTSCAVIGNWVMHMLIMNGTNISHPGVFVYLPLQASQLCDVFILGYGLSLKAADVDKKLLKSLQENQKMLEAERTRLAKDLHDGLGGLLSGIKLTLGGIPGNMVLSEKNAAIFTNALNQLDTTIVEMRRVAHSMMPEALLRFGLSEAIRDFCDGINETNTVKMRFVQIGSTLQLEQSTEIILYRIMQELTNNAIKHAASKNIFVQLNNHGRGITFTVEDDGKGFDITGLTKGAGLQNVQSRVDDLKGSLNIESGPGKGTSITIEIPLET